MNRAESAGGAKEPVEIGDRSDLGTKWTDCSGRFGSNEKLGQRAIDASPRKINQRIMRCRPVSDLILCLPKKCGSDGSQFEQFHDCTRRQPTLQLGIRWRQLVAVAIDEQC